MGANQSARKVTVVNDEASGVIKISDSVVQRLKGEISGDSQKQQQQSAPAPEPEKVAPPPAAPVDPTPPPPPPAQEAAPPPAPAPAPAPAPQPQSEPVIQQQVWQRPIIQYIEEPSISALRVKAEKEEEMKTQDDYWRDRLQKQEESFITNAKLTEGEIIKNAKYVETLFKPAVNKEICRESEQSVLSCYESNPGKPLLCREKVLAFTKCVSEARAGLVTPGG